MIRVGIIGCGKIADSHVEQIIRIKGAEIVATCDTEELMAKQLSERYNIPSYFNDAKDFLEKSRPDVVHITTPPQSHFELVNCAWKQVPMSTWKNLLLLMQLKLPH